MASSLGSLVIELVANTARFQSDMGKAFDGAKRGAEGFKKALEFVGVALSVNAIKNYALEAIKFGDEMQKASLKTGISGQALSELAFAARQADIDLGSLTGGITKMQKAISDAGSGGKEAKDVFAALGVNFAILKQLAPDQQFEALAEQINKLPNPADKARAAIALFGKSGADLLPLFSQGAEGIIKAREEAEKFGQSLNEKQQKSLAGAADQIKLLKESFSGLAITLTAKVAPGLTRFLADINEFASGGKLKNLSGDIERLQGLLESRVGQGYSKEYRDGILQQIESAKAELASIKGAGQKALTAATIANSVKPPGFFDADAWNKWLDKILPEKKLADLKIRVNSLDAFYDDLNTSTQTFVESQADSYRKAGVAIDELLKHGIIDPQEAKKRRDEMLDALLPDIDPNALKKKIAKFKEGTDEMSDIATDAAQRIKGAFVDFFYNPFDNALKRLVLTFIDALREMVARAAAARLFEAFGFGGGKSGVGGLASILGSFVGLASGGSFQVGGSGSTDSQLVAFRASPDETVHVTRPGQSVGSGGTNNVNVYVDLSGAFVDSKQALAAAVAQGAQRGVAQMTQLIRRGAFT